jgi:hypothetical protein
VSEAESGESTGPEEDRPWERPGVVRRDRVPHRGRLLRGLGVAAVIFGLLALPLAIPGVIALALAYAVFDMARHDLAEIRAGQMDPAGQLPAEDARFMSVAAAVITGVAWQCWGAYAFLLPYLVR